MFFPAGAAAAEIKGALRDRIRGPVPVDEGGIRAVDLQRSVLGYFDCRHVFSPLSQITLRVDVTPTRPSRSTIVTDLGCLGIFLGSNHAPGQVALRCRSGGGVNSRLRE